MKRTTLLVLAATLMLGMIPAQAVRTQPLNPTTNNKAEDCENLGGWWHCFPSGACSCF